MAGRTGRPRGSGIDDEAILDAVEDARRADPGLSQRAAIIAAVGEETHVVRRVERKLAERARMRAGDVRLLGARPFSKGEPRSTRLWSCLVDVPVPGHAGIAVTHSVVVGLPVMLVVRDEEPVEGARVPEHHVLRAVDGLPIGHGWDEPGYRACCGALGIDPDRGRPHDTPRLEAESRRLLDLSLGRGLPEDGPVHVLEDLACLDRNGRLTPHGLARLHARHVGDGSREAAEVRAEARAAFDRIDWPRSCAYTTLRWLAGPWGYDHHASIYFCGDEHDGLSSISGDPEIIVAPDPEDWVSIHAARLTERHCMAVTLSPGELDAFSAGGDRGYWLAARDWHTAPWARAKAEILRPDLAATHAILDAMSESAYGMYADRASGVVPAPDAPLSYETRAPIPRSRPRPRIRAFAEALGRGLREVVGLPGPRRAGAPASGTMRTPWGTVLVARQHGMALVRDGLEPLRVGTARVRLCCDFRPAFDWRGVPEVTSLGFGMTDARTGRPLPAAEAMPVLTYLSHTACAAVGLPGFRGRVIPPSWLGGIRIGAMVALGALAWACLA